MRCHTIPPFIAVSIAGAILWGVLPCGRRLVAGAVFVSIAGAILWGVLLWSFMVICWSL